MNYVLLLEVCVCVLHVFCYLGLVCLAVSCYVFNLYFLLVFVKLTVNTGVIKSCGGSSPELTVMCRVGQ